MKPIFRFEMARIYNDNAESVLYSYENSYFYKQQHELLIAKNFLNIILYDCYNYSSPNYKYFSSRGITVCDEWKDQINGLYEFHKWLFKEAGYDIKDPNVVIYRVNKNDGFKPNNCCLVYKNYPGINHLFLGHAF